MLPRHRREVRINRQGIQLSEAKRCSEKPSHLSQRSYNPIQYMAFQELHFTEGNKPSWTILSHLVCSFPQDIACWPYPAPYLPLPYLPGTAGTPVQIVVGQSAAFESCFALR